MTQEPTDKPTIIIPGSPTDPYQNLSLRILGALDRHADILKSARAEYWDSAGKEISGSVPGYGGGIDITDLDISTVAGAWDTALTRATKEYRHVCHQATLDLASRVMYAIGDGALKSENPGEGGKGGIECQSKYD